MNGATQYWKWPGTWQRAVALLLLMALTGALGAQGLPTISGKELHRRLQGSGPPLVLDVRTATEYAAGHIPGAINIPHGQLVSRLAQLAPYRHREIVVHCETGPRASFARSVLAGGGFSRLTDLQGHMAAWRAAQLPVVPVVVLP